MEYISRMKTEVVFIHSIDPQMFGNMVRMKVREGFRIVPDTMFGKFQRVSSGSAGLDSGNGFFCCEMARTTFEEISKEEAEEIFKT